MRADLPRTSQNVRGRLQAVKGSERSSRTRSARRAFGAENALSRVGVTRRAFALVAAGLAAGELTFGAHAGLRSCEARRGCGGGGGSPSPSLDPGGPEESPDDVELVRRAERLERRSRLRARTRAGRACVTGRSDARGRRHRRPTYCRSPLAVVRKYGEKPQRLSARRRLRSISLSGVSAGSSHHGTSVPATA